MPVRPRFQAFDTDVTALPTKRANMKSSDVEVGDSPRSNAGLPMCGKSKNALRWFHTFSSFLSHDAQRRWMQFLWPFESIA